MPGMNSVPEEVRAEVAEQRRLQARERVKRYLVLALVCVIGIPVMVAVVELALYIGFVLAVFGIYTALIDYHRERDDG